MRAQASRTKGHIVSQLTRWTELSVNYERYIDRKSFSAALTLIMYYTTSIFQPCWSSETCTVCFCDIVFKGLDLQYMINLDYRLCNVVQFLSEKWHCWGIGCGCSNFFSIYRINCSWSSQLEQLRGLQCLLNIPEFFTNVKPGSLLQVKLIYYYTSLDSVVPIFWNEIYFSFSLIKKDIKELLNCAGHERELLLGQLLPLCRSSISCTSLDSCCFLV